MGGVVVVAALVSFDHDAGADLVGLGDGVEDRRSVSEQASTCFFSASMNPATPGRGLSI
ncbi:hypothetical protein [Streptomyces sp. A0642]|uniref:hypothetical protein n=1 Tax=Streptomyces sp. A0642 TaxID=2563100 RepID=UPI0014454A4F|nr:hypothetical protein [Streptomyces sp. A0642]